MAAYVSFILSGHCSCYRVVQLSKKERQTFQVGNLETGGFFGESCVVHEKPAEYCVQTECITICLKLKKSDYEILGKDNFIKLIEMNKLVVPPDGDLEKLLVDCEAWHVFRSQEVRHVFNRKSAKKRALRSANNSSHDIHGSATDGFIQLQMVYSHLYDVDDNNDEEQTGSCSRAVGASSRSLPSISLTSELVHEKSAINLMTPTRGLSKSSSYSDDQKPGPGERFPDLDSYYKDMDKKLQILDTRALVTQARELADEYATRNTQKKTRPGVENRERWYTVIHESNELAKIRIAWGKYRMEILRRRLKKEREIRFNSTSLEDRKRAQEATAQRRSADDQKVKDEVKDRQDQGRNNFIANKYKNRWKSKRRHLLESLTSGYGAQMCPGDGTTKKLFISPRLPSRTTSYGQMSPRNQDKASPRIKFSFDI